MTPRPNIVFIMSDDHAAHAISAYGSRINSTPQIDRIAAAGVRATNAFCTNSICAPSRASILTGTYNHVNGVTTLATPFESTQPTFVSALHEAGWQTAIMGKWHLGHGAAHDPRGFDHWEVLPGQGDYHDPEFLTTDGPVRRPGYVTDVITDLALDWLGARDPDRPFCLLLHHKAPHRPWQPDEKHAHLYADLEVPEPATLFDDLAGRSDAARAALMRIGRDLSFDDLKADPPEGLDGDARTAWAYQHYIKDYLRCVASIDDNVGRVLDYLADEHLLESTIVVYTSDQGFFLGEHGWYDKRFMYEESLRMPLLVAYPGEIPAGSVTDEMVLNVDFAQTLLDYAGVTGDPGMQGTSIRGVLAGAGPETWRSSMYYRYWMHDDSIHRVRAHLGIRTRTEKLICYYGRACGQPGSEDNVYPVEWELFDLEADPLELENLIDEPAYEPTRIRLIAELRLLMDEVGDEPPPGVFDDVAEVTR